MIGHLQLVCGVDGQGRSYLREQSFCAPIHIGKPFTEEEVLVVNLVNPTAGLFEGDSIECRVEVDAGGRMLLTSPSASRAHRMQGGEARLNQEFKVEGFLEVLPELFIPQQGARYRQSTVIHVESGGELIFFESLAPGRVASGEAFAFQHLSWDTALYFGGTKILKEHYSLMPGDLSLQALRVKFPKAYYGSCFAIGSRFVEAKEEWEGILELQNESALIGASRLCKGGWVIKILAENSVDFRAVQNQLRERLYGMLGRPVPSLRR